MRVAVIGAGGMGGGIASLLAGIHEVRIGSRDPEQGARKAEELSAARGGSYAEVTADADVVFLTIPWTAVGDTLPQLGDLAGRILVDVTNPFGGGELQLHEDSSDAEEIQRRLPSARVVKGWNTIYAPVLAAGPDFGGVAASVFLASDDDEAKAAAASLARDMGFDPVDCGPLSAARDLEKLLAIQQALGHRLEWGSWALSVLTRTRGTARGREGGRA